MKPNFLYIGAGKAGSSWIYEILREHPEVFVPDAKDIYFFDKNYDRGLHWYLAHFEHSVGRKAIGELSHDYFLHDRTAQRIHEMLPDARLICCLREPFDRTLSAYLYGLTIFLKRTTFEQFAFSPETLKESDYYNNLLPFYRLFPANHILVLFYDELKWNPEEFAARIYSFLAVSSDFRAASLHRVVLGSRMARSQAAAHVVYKVAQLSRNLGFVNIVGKVKRTSFFNKLLYREREEKPTVPAEIKLRLRQHFAKDYEKLEELISRKLPAAWRDP